MTAKIIPFPIRADAYAREEDIPVSSEALREAIFMVQVLKADLRAGIRDPAVTKILLEWWQKELADELDAVIPSPSQQPVPLRAQQTRKAG